MNRLGLQLSDFSEHDPVLDMLNVLQAERSAKSEIRELVQRLQKQKESLRTANKRLENQNRTILATQEELKSSMAEERKLAHVASHTHNAVIITMQRGESNG